MLLQFNVRNFAIIKDISISFEEGFNVLIGETGAGKSILIDAIQYVLGEKFDKSFIRTGNNKTYAEAIFTIENDKLKHILDEMGIEYEDDILIISRETFQSGKNIAKVNGKSILISQLKKITSNLIDIHGQNKNLKLFNNNIYIDYIDSYGKNELNSILNKYQSYYYDLQSIDKQISKIKNEINDKEKITDFLKYQINEINNSNLKIGEDKEIEQKIKSLSNYEKISKNLNQSYELLHEGVNNSYSIIDALSIVIKNLREIQDDMEEAKKIADNLDEIYFSIESIIDDINKLNENVYYDKDELEQLNRRIYEIDNYKLKYGKTIEEIFSYRDSIQKKYEYIINSEDTLNKLYYKRNELIKKMDDICLKMHNIRCKLSSELENKIKEELSYVGLSKTKLKLDVRKNENFNLKGKDNVQFLISTNPGQSFRPIAKIASGGELSRIMLAIKTVIADNDKIPTIIFDEIDAGISGEIAQRVGEKMFMISKSHQIFCITHLPQIAALSENLYFVSKHSENDETYTTITKLNSREKEIKIANMITGNNLTDLSIKNAKEIIHLADQKKLQL